MARRCGRPWPAPTAFPAADAGGQILQIDDAQAIPLQRSHNIAQLGLLDKGAGGDDVRMRAVAQAERILASPR
jgi:hypothetical protein